VSVENLYDDDPNFSTYWQSANTVSSLGNVSEQVKLTVLYVFTACEIIFTKITDKLCGYQNEYNIIIVLCSFS